MEPNSKRRYSFWSRLAIAALWVFIATISTSAQPRPQPTPGRPPDRYLSVLAHLEAMTVVPLNQWRYHPADAPHPEDPSFADSTWTPVTFGPGSTNAPESGSTGWYRAWIELPANAGGKDLRGARVQLVLRVSAQARVFFNGSMVAQGNGRLLLPILISQSAVPGQRILVAVNTSRLSDARLSIDYPNQPDPSLLRREILAAVAILSGFPNGNAEREQQLDAVVNAIDLAAIDRGDPQAFSRSLEKANHELQPLHEWMKQFSVLAIGNSHIDMAWLWPWTETVEVVRDTFTTALQLMREYPDFKYTASSAQAFAWMEEKYPDLFRQIQQRVKEGRWEIVGGMWVEPDLNLPDGESLVRQLLVGKRYFQQKFGVDVHIGWNPDSFGYNWQLPQIYKRSGIDYFVTQKMSWNETTVFPHKLFWWQSPDGSRVLTFFPHRYDNGVDPVDIAGQIAAYAPATGFPELMHLYGVGDHGGGPTRAMLDEAVALQDPAVAFPRLTFSTAQKFFSDLQTSVDSGAVKPPVWNDELYLEYHRGCYTTQAETKKLIRENEELLQNAEKFAAFSFLSGRAYAHDQLEDSWKKLLFDHFHDIMPGSGIAINYVDAARNLGEVTFAGQQVLHGALDDIAARANTAGAGVPVVIFNPLSWARTGDVEVEVPMPLPGQTMSAQDGVGKWIPSQVISNDAATNKMRLRILARSVPPLGYEVIRLVPVTMTGYGPLRVDLPELGAFRELVKLNALQANGTTLENKFLKVIVDSKTGCVTSLINKSNAKETLPAGACGNLLQAFVDKPLRQDAWEIRFDQESWDLKTPEEVKLIENGPVRAVVRVKHKFRNSTIVQDIILAAGSPRVDVQMQVDWHEQHILLKVALPVSVQADRAAFEIPYGSIERPTTRNTPAEQARFEVPALRWADLSDSTHGASLLNASKYGYDVKGNVIRLSLLRAATYPGQGGECCTDQGRHEFTYALYPHQGSWRNGGTMQQGYELNYPLLAVATTAHGGSLPGRHSFAGIDASNVVLTVVKKAEDANALIFRFYEFAGEKTNVTLHLPDKAISAFETNLMEQQDHPLTLAPSGRELVVPTGPYEIKTVKVVFGSAQH